MNQKYTKKEHLKKDSQIKFLFENGSWCNKYPLKIIYCNAPDNLNHSKIGVSVSKRNFKKAVHRNYIKRMLRECYRLNKDSFNLTFNTPKIVMIIYASNEILSFQEIEKKYLDLLKKITDTKK